MIVILVSPHLAHVIEHGGRERRHAQGLGTLCAIAVRGALGLKLTSAIPKTRCLEALKILELTEILVCMVIVPAVLNANLTARIAAQAIKLWLWELWRASCDRGRCLLILIYVIRRSVDFLISTVRLTS